MFVYAAGFVCPVNVITVVDICVSHGNNCFVRRLPRPALLLYVLLHALVGRVLATVDTPLIRHVQCYILIRVS